MTAPLTPHVHAAIAGDAQAFDALVARHYRMVCAITLAMTGSRQASEDAAQDALVAAWTSLPTLDDPDRFAPWLRQLTRNRTRQFLRSRGRRLARVSPDSEEVDLAMSSAGSADAALEQDEQERALAEAIDRLPEDTREVVILYYQEGKRVAEVAEALGLTEAAVRKRLSRARAALRDDLDEHIAPALVAAAPTAAFRRRVASQLAPRGAGRPVPSPHAPSRLPPGALSWTVAGALLGSAVTAWWLWPAPMTAPPPAVPVPVQQAPAPAPALAPPPAPTPEGRVRFERPLPAEPPTPPPTWTIDYQDLGPLQRVEQSTIVNALWRVVDAACLSQLDLDEPVTFDVETVVDAGGLQSLIYTGLDMPPPVQACVDDVAWRVPWPGVDGELTQRHTATYHPGASVLGPDATEDLLDQAEELLTQLRAQQPQIEDAFRESEDHPDEDIVVFEGETP